MTRFMLTTAGIALAGALLSSDANAAGPDLVPIFDVNTGRVAVRNIGDAVAGPSFVTIECAPAGRNPCPEPPPVPQYENPAFPNKVTVKVPRLGKGKLFKHKLSFYGGLVFLSGSYNFTVIADDGNNVAEGNEANNTIVEVKTVP